MAIQDQTQQTSKVGDESALVADNKNWLNDSQFEDGTKDFWKLPTKTFTHTKQEMKIQYKDHAIMTQCSTFLDNGHYLQPNSAQKTDNANRTFLHHENRSVSQI